MTAYAFSRGWLIEYKKDCWIYLDTKQIISSNRSCKLCGRQPTVEGHDACLGTLSNVKSACCGHGRQDQTFLLENQ